jgi:hypothetical protein
MKSIIRRQLSMVSRVRDFCRAHPSDSPGYVEALAQLEERLGRAELLAAQQDNGVATRRGSTEGKSVLRQVIRENHLRHLVRIARGAASVNPELPKRFRLPSKSLSGIAFIAQARALVNQAMPFKDLFIQDGMSATFLEDLNRVIAEYEAAEGGQNQGVAMRVGAVTELPELTKELIQLVKRFDGLNLLRFQHDPEKRGAWLSARNVAYQGIPGPVLPPVQVDIKPAA